jgi:hypothetical protein
MSSKRAVVLLVVALAVYFALIGYRAFGFLGDDDVVLKVLGGAVLVLPLVGAWIVVAEVRFGRITERMARAWDGGADGGEDGGEDGDAASMPVPEAEARSAAAPEDWRSWYQLAVAYDDAGDRRRARQAMRTAIEHYR